MKIQRIYSVYWSATGNSRKVARTVSDTMGECLGCPVKEFDFTLPQARETIMEFSSEDLAVVVLPTYAGKLPNKMLPFVQTGIVGNGTPAIPLVTFGNRSFDNSLAELVDSLKANHFSPIAVGAVVCRHAFTDLLATGRPTEQDLEVLKQFARKAAEKILVSSSLPAPVAVPGDSTAPYYIPKGLDGQPAKFLKAKPKTNLDSCIRCGTCARLCPMGAISSEDFSQVPGTCIKCQRCIRSCPKKAKCFDDPAFLSHVAMLEANFRDSKENSFYL